MDGKRAPDVSVTTADVAGEVPEAESCVADRSAAQTLGHAGRQPLIRRENLLRSVFVLALPVVVEQWLHSFVGLTDTYLANHIVLTADLSGEALDAAHAYNRASAAAVGSVMYFLWFVGLLASSVGIGATALISRATGARHKRVASAVVGQTLLCAATVGLVFGALLVAVSPLIAPLTGLSADAQPLFVSYVRIIGWAMPLALIMMASASCLRGGGDTISPAIAVMIVDIVNAIVSFSLVRGWFGLPELGFTGIAIGTTSAYCVGAILQVLLLLRRNGKVRLFVHRLKPNLAVTKRILRIGLPSGAEMMLQWMANFGVLFVVNNLGNAGAAAHLAAIRIEAFSFMTGMGFSVAASTLVGQSLGMKDVARARRCAYLAYGCGGGAMLIWGLGFIVAGPQIAALILQGDPEVVALTGMCLRITGVIQIGFAAAMIFGGALRGAGDTISVMIVNLASIIGVRLTLVLIVGRLLHASLPWIWVVLCSELMLRGALMFARFRWGPWHKVKV
jgi:putative MATE family efflux protein